MSSTSYDVCGGTRLKEEVLTSIVPTIQSDVSVLQKLYNLEFVVEADRLRSFDDWPISINQKPKELSHAGFFYTGKGDRVKCFCCGGGLKGWEQGDDPWLQHAMLYSNCEYLKFMKGRINFLLKK